jgi:SAM-dependent methyltransferase
MKQDLSEGVAALAPEQFDFAYSNAVWEHVRHPFSMLKAVHGLLKPGATFYIVANLYRGPKASHRYRQVFFPWPHLLFTDEVFEQYYTSIGRPPMRAAWVNRLSIGDYFLYFDLVGFQVAEVSYSMTPIDEPFYQRFSDILERYPRYDLERDFLHAVLVKDS